MPKRILAVWRWEDGLQFIWGDPQRYIWIGKRWPFVLGYWSKEMSE